MIIMTFGYAFHTVIGTVVSAKGGPEVAQALDYGVAVIPMALLLGTLGFLLMYAREKRKKHKAH
jgi:hypothetical protein